LLQFERISSHKALVVTVVTASVILFLVSGCMLLSFTFSILLPNPIATRVMDLHLRLLRLLPTSPDDIVIVASGWGSLIGLIVGACMSLIAGMRTLRKVGPSRRAIGLASCGLVLAAFLCVGPFVLYSYERAVVDWAEADARATDVRLRRLLEQGLVPAARRQQVWQGYAQSVYWSQGVSVEIPDERGGKTLYRPAASEIASRQSMVELRTRFLPPYRFTALAIGLVAVSVALGLLTPISTKPPYWPGGGAPTNIT
jgi:hypothetical protein